MEEAIKKRAKRRHLNAADCEELSHSVEGVGALTQPHTLTHTPRNYNPNRGLYPRPSYKRPKSVLTSAVSSSRGKQMCITNFFPVTNNHSSQPKSSQPRSSTQTHNHNHNRELFPKQRMDNVEDEEDSDDDSLLAGLISPDPGAEVEEDETQVDYLEGMTSEMFGDDEAFEDLEDVEALPDAHFGLLGSSGSPVQPQGCVDDLPEEVLWQVLCLVPAQDLYRNVSLVCHRWKNIVHDPEFVPYKKKYYRYMMGEKDTVAEIGSTLRTSGINRG